MTIIPTQLRQKSIDVGANGAIVSVFYFWQSDIRKISEDIFKLGILHGTSNEEASVDEQPEMMTFAHKLFHEYWAAYYASKRLSKVNSKVIISYKRRLS